MYVKAHKYWLKHRLACLDGPLTCSEALHPAHKKASSRYNRLAQEIKLCADFAKTAWLLYPVKATELGVAPRSEGLRSSKVYYVGDDLLGG